MHNASAALDFAQYELPVVKCAKCGADAKIIAYDRKGLPLLSCATPGCKGHWTSQHTKR